MNKILKRVFLDKYGTDHEMDFSDLMDVKAILEVAKEETDNIKVFLEESFDKREIRDVLEDTENYYVLLRKEITGIPCHICRKPLKMYQIECCPNCLWMYCQECSKSHVDEFPDHDKINKWKDPKWKQGMTLKDLGQARNKGTSDPHWWSPDGSKSWWEYIDKKKTEFTTTPSSRWCSVADDYAVYGSKWPITTRTIAIRRLVPMSKEEAEEAGRTFVPPNEEEIGKSNEPFLMKEVIETSTITGRFPPEQDIDLHTSTRYPHQCPRCLSIKIKFITDNSYWGSVSKEHQKKYPYYCLDCHAFLKLEELKKPKFLAIIQECDDLGRKVNGKDYVTLRDLDSDRRKWVRKRIWLDKYES